MSSEVKKWKEDRPISIAFIGAGAVNFGGAEGPWDHSKRLEQLGGVQFVAIVDPLVKKAEEVLKEKKDGPYAHLYTHCKVMADYKELLSLDDKPDAVFIGVPPFCHGSHENDIELQLVKAGVHVFIEKPISVQPPDQVQAYVEELSRVAKEQGVIVSVAYMFRYHDAIDKMKEIIKEHGRPLMLVKVSYNCAYTELDHPFWWDVKKSGGPIVEQATHLCDLLRYFGGEVDFTQLTGLAIPATDDPSVVGYLSTVPVVVKEQNLPSNDRIPRLTSAQWKFTSGTVGSLTHGVSLHCQRYEANIDIWADGLRIALEEPYYPECKLRVRRGYTNDEEIIPFPNVDPYYREDEAFLTAVSSGDSSVIRSSYEDAFKTYTLSWAIRRASTSNNLTTM